MKVAWTRLALQDLNSAHEYISTESPAAARLIVERIEFAVKALGGYPEIGRPGRVKGTKELVISGTPFIAAYRRGDQQVEIVAIIHSARQWPDSL